MGLVEFLLWLLFGGVAGWLASVIVGKNAQFGVVGNIVIGIVGAFIGGLLFPHDATQFDLGSLLAAVVGAVILLVIVGLFTRGSRTRI